MSKIILGQRADGGNLSIDLDVLLRTRLLVQANSGGGKSWLLRRLAEQLFGKVPVIIIDPEGEFATLREKFGYVLVGKGGETPADSRSAAMVAHKLLELKASAVCDIYELKPHERHHWIRLFLDALIDAPKNLWHPTVVMVDEAHTFCPEGKAGESEASSSLVDLSTRGRKRGFCAIFATQRLGKLRKDATAELLNRLVGPTFEDIDLERAADLLSVAPHDKREFFESMRVLEPGNFFGLGRALCKHRELVKIGPTETTHPELGSAKFSASPPPPPEKVKELLPKLADLPRQAEEQAKTVAEFKSEIRSLKAQLRERPSVEVAKTETKIVEIPIFKNGQVAAFERAAGKLFVGWEKVDETGRAIVAAAKELTQAVHKVAGMPKTTIPMVAPRPLAQGVATIPRLAPSRVVTETADGEPDSLQQKILNVIATLKARGLSPNREMVARWMGIHPNGGRYLTNLARLRELGLIEERGCELTTAGEGQAVAGDTGLDNARCVLDGTQQEIFDQLSGGQEHNRESLAAQLGIHPNGGRFLTNLARLRTMGLIPERGTIKLTEAAFQ